MDDLGSPRLGEGTRRDYFQMSAEAAFKLMEPNSGIDLRDLSREDLAGYYAAATTLCRWAGDNAEVARRVFRDHHGIDASVGSGQRAG